MSPLSTPPLDCQDPQPRDDAQGIHRVEVDDKTAEIIVTFFQEVSDELEDRRAYTLTGGQRLFPRVVEARRDVENGRRVCLKLSELGDFSVYTLTVSGGSIDPFFASRTLRFRLACDDSFDCRPEAPAPSPAPEIPVHVDYLAKDYASFRQALLDFIPTRMPAWTERSEADIGMMLLELFAATADDLSYVQDRVANEAFLETATQRRSVSGHLALLGYEMDNGASAHTWLRFQVQDEVVLPLGESLKVASTPRRDGEPAVVFETLGEVRLHPTHNRGKLRLYTWGHSDCCLPKSSISAALDGEIRTLQAGDCLLLEDEKRSQRAVVRLSAAPEIPRPVQDRPALTLVTWVEPLAHEFCVADTRIDGNLVLATHGETVAEAFESPGPAAAPSGGNGAAKTPRRMQLRLSTGPLAYVDPSTVALGAVDGTSTTRAQQIDRFAARTPRAVSTLRVKVDGSDWQEVASLLESRGDASVYRVEIDDRGDATVVFGDGKFGRRPNETSSVVATYRIGGGVVGNVGAGTLVQLLAEPIPGWFKQVTNPLPALGGRDPESSGHARRYAPETFRKPLAAVTEADYSATAESLVLKDGCAPVQRAAAAFRWTGSWLTVVLAVDPRESEVLDEGLRRALVRYLDERRLCGYDLEIRRALYVPIEMQISICVAEGFRGEDVKQAIYRALGAGALARGRRGLFHPDNFTFGDRVYVSRVFAAVMEVPGVESAEIARLARLHSPRPNAETAFNLRRGALEVGADQIVRLDNDRNFPENGTLRVRVKGEER